ncbi:LysM repeat protein [Desulfitispora alkaliphila]|uniref:LysM peptidoglycan-binding domain-containing protein n=1 Tax=Desulfitispora alkaliphila TaxID=622674 RepID=UPI003D1E562F
MPKNNEPPNKVEVNIVTIPGDSLFSLARIFSVLNIEDILALNPGIINPNVIFPGQIIAIPSVAPVPPDAPSSPAQYLVRPGDSLFIIAQRFGLTVPLLLEVNPQIVNPNIISVNQVINLPVTPPLPSPMETIQIYVSVGETLLSISRRTGVSLQAIIAANPQIVDPNLIFLGQIINVPLSF